MNRDSSAVPPPGLQAACAPCRFPTVEAGSNTPRHTAARRPQHDGGTPWSEPPAALRAGLSWSQLSQSVLRELLQRGIRHRADSEHRVEHTVRVVARGGDRRVWGAGREAAQRASNLQTWAWRVRRSPCFHPTRLHTHRTSLAQALLTILMRHAATSHLLSHCHRRGYGVRCALAER